MGERLKALWEWLLWLCRVFPRSNLFGEEKTLPCEGSSEQVEFIRALKRGQACYSALLLPEIFFMTEAENLHTVPLPQTSSGPAL